MDVACATFLLICSLYLPQVYAQLARTQARRGSPKPEPKPKPKLSLTLILTLTLSLSLSLSLSLTLTLTGDGRAAAAAEAVGASACRQLGARAGTAATKGVGAPYSLLTQIGIQMV